MAKTILEAIQLGEYEFEPRSPRDVDRFEETNALPGSTEKVGILAERIERGLPLWHPEDRRFFRDDETL